MSFKLFFLSLVLTSLIGEVTATDLDTGYDLRYPSDSKEEIDLSDWKYSSLSKYVSKDRLEEIISDSERDEKKRNFVKSKVVTIDTRDKDTCLKIQRSLRKQNVMEHEQLKTLCLTDEDNPFINLFIENEKFDNEISFMNNLSTNQKILFKETRNFAVLGSAMIGVLLLLPESITKWDKSKAGSLGDKWKENVKAGPVVDKDDWFINYIGHPLSGMAYHVRARKAGLNKWESFGFSVFMSTVFWEYGLEAFAETPSIQDLIITPIVGSLMGELAFSAIEKIEENKGMLWGSNRMGSIASALLDPAGSMSGGINKLFESDFIQDSKTSFYYEEATEDNQGVSGNELGIKLEFTF
jgi:hypothetical protein